MQPVTLRANIRLGAGLTNPSQREAGRNRPDQLTERDAV